MQIAMDKRIIYVMIRAAIFPIYRRDHMRKVRLIGLLLALSLLWGCGGGSKSKPASKKDLEKTVTAAMTALTVGEVEEPVFLGTDGEAVSLSGHSGIAGKIAAGTTFEVVSVEGKGKSGKAVLDITTADAVTLVYSAIEGMETFDQAQFLTNLEKLLPDAPVKTFRVEVELQQVDGRWLVVMNAQLSNAITGGLLDEYNTLQQKLLENAGKDGAQS